MIAQWPNCAKDLHCTIAQYTLGVLCNAVQCAKNFLEKFLGKVFLEKFFWKSFFGKVFLKKFFWRWIFMSGKKIRMSGKVKDSPRVPTWKERIMFVMRSGKWFTKLQILDGLGMTYASDRILAFAVGGYLLRLITSGHIERAEAPPAVCTDPRDNRRYVYRITGKPYVISASEIEKSKRIKIGNHRKKYGDAE
jgi:hypothetical protein